MYVRAGFRIFEVYDLKGNKIKDVYTAEDAEFMSLKGFDVRIRYIKS